MKVKPGYYDKLDRVTDILPFIEYCNATETISRKTGDRKRALMVKRMKCFALRFYDLRNGQIARICPEWETNPEAMLTWMLEHEPQGINTLKRKNKFEDFSPENCYFHVI